MARRSERTHLRPASWHDQAENQTSGCHWLGLEGGGRGKGGGVVTGGAWEWGWGLGEAIRCGKRPVRSGLLMFLSPQPYLCLCQPACRTQDTPKSETGDGSTDLQLDTSTKLKMVSYWWYRPKHKKKNLYLNNICKLYLTEIFFNHYIMIYWRL